MIPALIGLREACDQALALLAQLEPVIDAWRVANPGGDEEADGEPAEAAVDVGRPPVAPNGSAASGEPHTAIDEASEAAAGEERQCGQCGAPFSPVSHRQLYCGDGCRKAAMARRRVVARAAAGGKLSGRPRRRRGTPPLPAAESSPGEPPTREPTASPNGLAVAPVPDDLAERYHLDARGDASDPDVLKPPALPWEERA